MGLYTQTTSAELKMFFNILVTVSVISSTTSVSIIEGEIFKGEELPEIFGGSAPPDNLNLTSSCPCSKVLVSSLGPAATVLPKVMGVYTQSYTSYNAHPSYRQNYGND